jgi:glutaredoxin 1
VLLNKGEIIKMNVEIYTKDGCGYCIKAKNLLENKNINYKEYKVGSNGVTKELIQERAGKPINTVPQIFINGKHIGGYTELVEYNKYNPL